VIGQRFGNYRALSLIGEGGMGTVYLAEHPDIGRRVAVKVLLPELSANKQLLQRFLNEARAANAIHHPNIIEILDSGTTPEGVPYLVMELLEGETVSSRLRRLGPFSIPAALELAYQAASAVGAAHRKGIVHRDLKPDNLFIIPDPSEPTRERIKVLDFGIAKLLTVPQGDALRTRTGTLMGTPVYMSPEQCRGTREVDHRSDVYSMGVILFEMVCGRPPFYSQGFGELVNLHLNAPPPPPRTIKPDVPEAVEAIILRALAKAPEQRFASMEELQQAIKAASDGTFTVRGVSRPELLGGTLPAMNTPSGTVSLPVASTTFSHGTGEKSPPPRSRNIGRMFLAGLAALIIGGGAGMLRGHLRAKPAVKPPAVAAALPDAAALPPAEKPPQAASAELTFPKVRLEMASRPAGAKVVDTVDGEVLGTTPFHVELARSEAELQLRFEKAGYEPQVRPFKLDADSAVTVDLARRRKGTARHKPRPAAAPVPDEPAKL
jgi:serine/threonine protein kinase